MAAWSPSKRLFYFEPNQVSCVLCALESLSLPESLQYNLAMTDSAENDTLQSQGKRLHDHEQMLSNLVGGVQDLHGRQDAFQAAMTGQLHDLSTQMQQVLASLNPQPSLEPTPPPPAMPEIQPALRDEPPALHVEKYNGDSSTCCSSLTLCSLTFELQPLSFPTE